MKMEVELLVYTPCPDFIAATAMRSCHTVEPAHRLRVDKEWTTTMVQKAKAVKHYSVLEHASFTFSVGGVSRALTHQLVRHRLASYSQQSQRHVKLDPFEYVIPPSIKDGIDTRFPKTEDIFKETMNQIKTAYSILIKRGIPPEDARFVLPNACTTNIVITMNARELLHFFHLRCSSHAQWEIREMANRMLDLCKKAAPVIFEGNPEEWE
jgi:thymidylate synthase (FAD)